MYRERVLSGYRYGGLLYRVYRVYDGVLREWQLRRLASILDRFIVEYSIDGYTYLHLTRFRSDEVGDSSLDFEKALLESLDLDMVGYGFKLGCYVDIELPSTVVDEAIVSEGDLGYILVADLRFSKVGVDKTILGYGLYRGIPCSKPYTYITDLEPRQSIYLNDLVKYINEFLLQTSNVRPSKTDTPLKLRKKHIHMDGSLQYLKGYYIRIPDISLDIPLDHHIFLLGKTRSGKSVSIANIVKYIVNNKLGKAVIFDWVGNFLTLDKLVKDSVIVRPGEDIGLDLFKIFDKSILPEVYEEASQLYFKGLRNALFTPAVYERLNEAVEKAENHFNLIEILKMMRSRGKEEDRNSAAALLRRINSLDPTLYVTLDDEYNMLEILDGYGLTIVDLSNIAGEWDKILFTLISLKAIQVSWSSRKPRLYIVIDEVHRLAPRNNDREWLLNRIIREGLKYNLHLILADQTLMNISEDVWGNIGYRFIFNLDNSRDIDKVAPYLYPDKEQIKSHHELTSYIVKMLRLKPGECILINQYNSKPVDCYYRSIGLSDTGEVDIIDYNRIGLIARELGLKMNRIEDLKAIIKARRLIRKYSPSQIMELLDEFHNDKNMNTLKMDDITLAIKERDKHKYRKPLQIYLKYHYMSRKI